MTDVYISHFGENSQSIAENIKNKLSSDGTACFSTPAEKTEVSENALKECKVFVIVLNQAASYAKQVLDEISTACVRYNGGEDITILPLQISDEEISGEAMSYIGRLHWTEAFDGDTESHINNFVSKIGDALKTGRNNAPQAFTIKPEQKNLYTAEKGADNKGKINILLGAAAVIAVIAVIGGIVYALKNAKTETPSIEGGIQYTVSSDGTTTWTEDGNTYTGTIENGVLAGEGKAEYANGSVYEGNFVNGAADGQGKCVFPNGNIYEGEWVDGKMTGYGKFYFAATGSVHEGMWENGLRNGEGKFTKADGEVWVGTWVDDLEEGDFTITYPDGTVEEYVFKDGSGSLKKSKDIRIPQK